MHDALKLEQADVCQLVLQLCVIPVGHGIDGALCLVMVQVLPGKHYEYKRVKA